LDLFGKIEDNMGPLGKHSEFADGYFSFPKPKKVKNRPIE